MYPNLTPHTWKHRNRHPSDKCTEILPLTHEYTEIIIPQVNAQESYPSPMNAPTSWSMKERHRNLTPHTWMHQNRHSSGKCTGISHLTHECTEIIIPQEMHRNRTPHTWMQRNPHLSGKCTGILPLTHECTKIMIHEVNALESYPSHMNAPKSSLLR